MGAAEVAKLEANEHLEFLLGLAWLLCCSLCTSLNPKRCFNAATNKGSQRLHLRLGRWVLQTWCRNSKQMSSYIFVGLWHGYCAGFSTSLNPKPQTVFQCSYPQRQPKTPPATLVGAAELVPKLEANEQLHFFRCFGMVTVLLCILP